MGWYDDVLAKLGPDAMTMTPAGKTASHGAPMGGPPSAMGAAPARPQMGPLQVTAPFTNNATSTDPRVAQLVQQYIQDNGLQANQSDPSSLRRIAEYLQGQGINAQVDYTDSHGHTGGLVINGSQYQLIDGSNNWTALQPWSESGGPGGGQGGGNGPGGGGFSPAGGYGSMMTPWTKDFNAPSAQDALNSPGLQFAMQQAQTGMERSAASHGTLLTGGLQNALARQQTGMALQGYGDVYNRAMGEYSLGRENFWANQDRPYSKLMGISSLGQNAAANVGNYGSSYANNANDLITGAGNSSAQGSYNQAKIWAPAVSNLSNLNPNDPYRRY